MSFNNHKPGNTAHLLTVSESVRRLPRIVLSGKWVRNWGFIIGDHLSATYVEPGTFALKPEPALESPCPSENCLQEIQEPPYSVGLYGYKSHPVTVRPSERCCPQITITGAWLCDWGIAIGDRVSVTRTAEVEIHIQVTISARQRHALNRKVQLEEQLRVAMAELESHKAANPELYGQPLNPAALPGTSAPQLKVAHPTAAELDRTNTPEFSTARAAS